VVPFAAGRVRAAAPEEEAAWFRAGRKTQAVLVKSAPRSARPPPSERSAAPGPGASDPYRPATSARCRAAFVRFPQIRIEHHWLDRLRERS